jgi:hypothetical protein
MGGDLSILSLDGVNGLYCSTVLACMEDGIYWWFLFLFLYSLFNCSSQLEKGVDGLFDSFARLDTRISSVGQTAAKIGDHLQVICSSEYLYFCIYYAYLLIVRL